MPSRLGALAVAAVLAASVGVGCRQPSRVEVDSVLVESPAMGVAVRQLVVQEVEGRQQWSFTLVCQEPAGCRGDLRLELVHRAGGGERTLSVTREVDLAPGDEATIGRVGSAEPVEGVDRVRVTVLRRQPTGPSSPAAAVRPTPRS